MKKHLSLCKILLTLLGFVFLWAVVSDAWGYSQYFLNFSNGNYIYAYLSRFVWVLPAILLINRYSDSMYLSIRQLFSSPCINRSLMIVIIASALYVIIEMLVYHQGFWFNSSVNLPLEVIKYVVVGFVEEAVFRGWGYNALAKITSDKKAIVISTALFIILHWPAYFIKLYRFGTFDLAGIVSQSFSALVWGIIFCYLLKKGKNLWNPIIAHTFYDLLSVLLVG